MSDGHPANERTDRYDGRQKDRQTVCVLLGQAAASWHLKRRGNSMGESDGPSSAHRKRLNGNQALINPRLLPSSINIGVLEGSAGQKIR